MDVVWFPLVLLAIPSVVLGYIIYMPILFDTPTLLAKSLFVLPDHNVLGELSKEVHSPLDSALEALLSPVFWLTISGIILTWIAYILVPALPGKLARWFAPVYKLLINKYGFDAFNDLVFVRGGKAFGKLFYRVGDCMFIDGLLVNGTGKTIRWFAGKGRYLQTGYLYHYASVMVLGLIVFLCWLLLG